jgi:hypothetical protein
LGFRERHPEEILRDDRDLRAGKSARNAADNLKKHRFRHVIDLG